MSKETSEEIASLAGEILNLTLDKIGTPGNRTIESLLEAAKRLAGSALAQREEEVPGTHAYDLLAAFTTADLDVTESLIQMTAATVLYKLIQDEGGGRANVRFSPADMDAMYRDYHIEAGRDGLITFVRIIPKEGTSDRLMVQDEDTSDALPQAEAKPERPLWAIREGTQLFRCLDQRDAQRQLAGHNPIAVIENRFCWHEECPSEHCNKPGD